VVIWTWKQHDRKIIKATTDNPEGKLGDIREVFVDDHFVFQRGSPLMPDDDGYVYNLIPKMVDALNDAEAE
jgi:hypothetical protein